MGVTTSVPSKGQADRLTELNQWETALGARALVRWGQGPLSTWETGMGGRRLRRSVGPRAAVSLCFGLQPQGVAQLGRRSCVLRGPPWVSFRDL